VGEAIHQLVVPEVPSSAESMRIHGILPKDLAEAQPLAVAGETLRLALTGRFLLAWFASVEIGFLGRLYGDGPLVGDADDRRPADGDRARALDQDVRQSLSSAAERYGVPVANPHEALDDAMVTAQLFLVLASRLEERGFGSARSFLRLTRI
jgi:DNA polymerase-3 subunit epsilon